MRRATGIFARRQFAGPAAEYYPGYFWVFTAPADEEAMLGQLRDMAAHDARSVCFHPCPREFRPRTMPTTMSPDYLSPGYFRLVCRLVAECRRLRMNFWLYDEGGWPSGGACGQVLARNPAAFERQYLVDSPKGPAVMRLKSDPQVAAPYPNLLTTGVTDTFIEMTHERYRRWVGKEFGATIRFVFTDEPCAPLMHPGRMGWCDDMGAVFRRRKGYAIEPFLPALLRPPRPREARAVTQARVDLHDVRSQLIVERYLHPIRAWCRRNNLLSGGHFGGEDEPFGNADYGYGHIMRALRGLDLPGVDVIWRQLFPAQPGGTVYYDEPGQKLARARGKLSRPFTKYASSVAHQYGRQHVVSETFAAFGYGLEPLQMKWVVDHQYQQGATMLVLSNISQKVKGDDILGGCRPHFGPADPLWPYFGIMHRYAARLGYLMTRGRAAAATACYYDVRGIWAGGAHRRRAIAQHFAMARRLQERQCDFDFIDDDALAAAVCRGGALAVGRMRYDTLVIPETRWMAPAARVTLARFEAAGGHVLRGVGGAAQAAPTVELSPRNREIRCTRRVWSGHALYFLTNESMRPVRVTILLPERTPPVRCDPHDGLCHAVRHAMQPGGVAVTWEFEPAGSLVLLCGTRADVVEPEFRPGAARLELDSGWTIEPLRRHNVGERDYEIIECKVRPRKTALGDWRHPLGAAFSGAARYAVTFDAPRGGDAILDLGDVRFACTVTLNGGEIGRRFWGPCRFNLSERLRRGVNRLEVEVSNTLANAIAAPGALRRRRAGNRPISPYDKMQYTFERESRCGGLYGPVSVVFGDKAKDEG